MYWIELLWYFIIISFLGWLFSCLYNFINEKKFYNKGFLTLPFSPTYGASALLCYLAFNKLSEHIFIMYVGTTLLLSFFSVLVGVVGEKILGCKPWDYSKMKFAIGNYITFPFALLLGLGGTFAVKALIPVIRLQLHHISDFMSMIIALSIAAVILIDYVFSFITIFRLKHRLSKFREDNKLHDEITEEELCELEKNYNRILTDNILRKRMTSAFPELRGSAYVKQVAEKLDEIKADNMKQYTAVYEKEEDKPFASGFCFEKLFMLFVIGSFIGTCIETVYAFFVEGHFECRVGLVYGPFIPVYGGGACLLTTVLYRLFKLSDTLIFIISAALGAFFEYICSWCQETFLGTVSWDYSDMPLNIGGRTCLLYACFWGFLGLIWLRYLYPFVSKHIERIPKKQGSVLLVVLVIFMAFNAVMTVIAVWRWNDRLDGEPAANAVDRYFDKHYDDERMKFLFPHMRDSESLEELQSTSATPDSATPDSAQ